MGGAKTACAFAPENIPPYGAGMGAGAVFPPMGGCAGALSFAHTDGEKIFFQNLHFYVDIILTLR